MPRTARIYTAALAALLLLLAGGCASRPNPLDEPVDVFAANATTAARIPAHGPEAFGLPAGSMGLQELLVLARRGQYPPVEDLRRPPPEALAGRFALVLDRAPVDLMLARGVAGFDVRGEALAVALADGPLIVYGPHPSPSVPLGRGMDPGVLALSHDGRFLAVAERGGDVAVVHDLAEGEAVGETALPAHAARLALSPDGGALAVAGTEGDVFAGPVGGPLVRLSGLAAAPDFPVVEVLSLT